MHRNKIHVGYAENDKIAAYLESCKTGSDGKILNSAYTRVMYTAGTNGALRVLHHEPETGESLRPVVFLPGWGTMPEGFTDFFSMLMNRTELYYIETREKNSSRLPVDAVMDMDRTALDLKEALHELGFNDSSDFLLMGTCWGSTVISHALARGFVSAPTVVVFDPMPRLWFPQWLLKSVMPFIPVTVLNLLRPLGRNIALAGMKEETQRKRAEVFINGADLKKWKRAALSILDFDLRDRASAIPGELLVFTGVSDKIHDQSVYPSFAGMVPGGRFFNLPVSESNREFLLGVIAREFSLVGKEQGVPSKFQEFELRV